MIRSVWVLGVMVWLVAGPASPAEAAAKVFSGGGTDATRWHDDHNWFAATIPTKADAVTIDLTGASVTATDTFAAQSITVGGKTTAALTADSFVYGAITPESTSDPAMLIRKNGTVVMKGAGVVVLKGPFKNTEESLPTEPSVMILLE